MVHQLIVNIESWRQILTVAILLCDDFSVWLIIFLNVLSVTQPSLLELRALTGKWVLLISKIIRVSFDACEILHLNIYFF